MTKPLRWRTGPVPEDTKVLYRWFCDGLGLVYGVGIKHDKLEIADGMRVLPCEVARWLPLAEILALVEAE